MILYSFNNSGFKKVSFRWLGFTTEWYQHLFSIPDMSTAVRNSLEVAIVSTLIATALGTMWALALVRYRYRGKQRSAVREQRLVANHLDGAGAVGRL